MGQLTASPDCSQMGAEFCHTNYNSQAFCDPSTTVEQQLGDGCSCPYGDKADAGNCTGPAPRTFFCKHDAKSNGCGKCTGDGDCGGEKDACWADKDAACPKMQMQLAASPVCIQMGADFCHTKYNSQAFCDPSTNAAQQLGD